MDACLVIIGLDSRTAPLAVRQRFRIDTSGVERALLRLSGMDGITESAIVANAERTDFILWTSDFSVAANSVLTFLTRAYSLKLCEWQHFHRLLGDEALHYLFRVGSGLDSTVPGDCQSTNDLRNGWLTARQAGTSGPLLDQVFDRALQVAEHVHSQVALAGPANDGRTAPALAAAEQLVASELREFRKQLASERALAAH